MPDNTAAGARTIRGKAFGALVLTRVRQAGTDIRIDTHALEFDTFGQALLSELEYACQRGLRVRCLLDERGSRNFLRDHPALLVKLETAFRIHPGGRAHGSSIVFDRRMAVVGSHTLREAGQADEDVSRVVTGPAAEEIADEFRSIWEDGEPIAKQ